MTGRPCSTAIAEYINQNRFKLSGDTIGRRIAHLWPEAEWMDIQVAMALAWEVHALDCAERARESIQRRRAGGRRPNFQ